MKYPIRIFLNIQYNGTTFLYLLIIFASKYNRLRILYFEGAYFKLGGAQVYEDEWVRGSIDGAVVKK